MTRMRKIPRTLARSIYQDVCKRQRTILLLNLAAGPNLGRDSQTLNQLDEVHHIEAVHTVPRNESLMLTLVWF